MYALLPDVVAMLPSPPRTRQSSRGARTPTSRHRGRRSALRQPTRRALHSSAAAPSEDGWAVDGDGEDTREDRHRSAAIAILVGRCKSLTLA